MSAAAATLDRIERPAVSATRGVYQLRSGLEGLALEAAGLDPKLGRVTQGLLAIGGGGALAIGAAAGLGLIAAAFKAASAEIQHFSDMTEKAIEGARRLLGSAHQAAIVARAEVQGRLVDARAELQRLQTEGIGARNRFETAPPVIDEAEIIKAQTAVRALEFELGLANTKVNAIASAMGESLAKGARASADGFEKARLALELQNAELRNDETAILRLTIATTGFTEAQVKLLKSLRDTNTELDLMNDLARIQGGINLPAIQAQLQQIPVGLPGPAIRLTNFDLPGFLKDQQALIEAEELARQTANRLGLSIGELGRAELAGADAAERAARAHEQSAAIMISAAFALAQALVSGGGLGGILSGVGGLLTFVNPLAGAIVTGIGGFITALDAHDERRHAELLDALEPVGELLVIVARDRLTSPDDLDALARRLEEISSRRIVVRLGGAG